MRDGAGFDFVWNYGVFDFAQPNFIYRFVKGETDYMLLPFDTRMFLEEYRRQGRHVVEQDLNLSQAEARRLLEYLQMKSLPENRTYRYNYVKDNCATRIIDDIDKAVGDPVVYPDSVTYGTFRNEMRAYHSGYPWYQFGIDLALGSGIDYPLAGREEMFVPIEMMRKAGGAHMQDGRPLVSATRVLNEGVKDATLGPTPWFLRPVPVCWAVFLLAAVCCWLQWRRKTLFRLAYCLWFLILGLTGCLLAFLVFVSEHEATSPNVLILWLNPLQLIVAVGVWFRRAWRVPVRAVIWLDIILLTLLMISWPVQTQSANPGFFPLMGATWLMSVAYAIISPEISYITSRNNHGNEEVGHLGAGGARNARRRGPGGSGTTASRGRNRR